MLLRFDTRGPKSWTGRLATLIDSRRDGNDAGRAGGANALLRVRLAGPFGRSAVNIDHFRDVLLVCGGIGVTPMIAQYSALRARGATVWLVWVVRDRALVQLILPEFGAAPGATSVVSPLPPHGERPPPMRARAVVYFTGPVEAGVPSAPGPAAGAVQVQSGRPNLSDVLESFLAAARGVSGGSAKAPVAVLACASGGLMSDLQRAVDAGNRCTGNEFCLHTETFEY